MDALRKKSKRLLAAAAAFLVFAGAGLIFQYLVDSSLPRHEIKKRISKQIESIFPFAYRIGQIKYSIFSGIVIENIAISSEDDFNQGEYLLQSPRTLLKIPFWQFLGSGQPAVHEVILEKPEIRVQAHNGEFIWDYLIKSRTSDKAKNKPAEKEKPAEQNTRQPLTLKDLVIEDAFLFPAVAASDFSVRMNGAVHFSGSSGTIEAVFDFLKKRQNEWQTSGQVISSGRFAEEIPAPPPGKAAGKEGDKAADKKKGGSNAQAPAEGVLHIHITNELKEIDPVALLYLGGLEVQSAGGGLITGSIDSDWKNELFVFSARVNWSEFDFGLFGGISLRSTPVSLSLDYKHNLNSHVVNGFKMTASNTAGDAGFSVDEAALSRDEGKKVIDHFKGKAVVRAGLAALTSARNDLSFDGRLNTELEFSYNRKDWYRPLSLTGRSALTSFILSDRRVEAPIFKESALSIALDKDWKFSAVVELIQKASRIEWKTTGNWDTLRQYNDHTKNTVLVIKHDTDHNIRIANPDLADVKKHLQPLFASIKESARGRLQSGPVDTFFRETDLFYRWFKNARMQLKLNMKGAVDQGVEYPDFFINGRLSHSQANFDISTSPAAGSQPITDKNGQVRERSLEGSVHINLISNKPTFVTSLKATAWKPLAVQESFLYALVPARWFDFDITATCYGTTIAELYHSLAYRGNLALYNLVFQDTPWQNALLLHPTRLKQFPRLERGNAIEFNELEMRFRFSEHQGNIDLIRLDGPVIKLTGRGRYSRDQDKQLNLTGLYTTEPTSRPLSTTFTLDRDGKIKKSTIE